MKKHLYRLTVLCIALSVLMSNIPFFSFNSFAAAEIFSGTTDQTNCFNDDLDDWSEIYACGADLRFSTNKPEQFEGDFSRVVRSGNESNCWISWYYEGGISEFAVVTFWENKPENITVSVSTNNSSWTVLDNAVTEDKELCTGWYKRTFKYFGINSRNKYVKVDISALNGETGGPMISRIRINKLSTMDSTDRYLEGRAATTLYVDSVGGSDYNSGLTERQPIKSLKKLSERYFQPGDKILFKSGRTFKGNVYFKGMGSAGQPITIGTYGGEEKAKIQASSDSAVFLRMQYVSLENLEITNPDGTTGIYVLQSDLGQNNDISIKNCYIHDVNTSENGFTAGKYDTGGILVTVDGIEPTWINNLVIENNTIENTARCGIMIDSKWAYRPGTWGHEGYYRSDSDGWYPITNTVIRKNTVNGCMGDSILVTCAKNTLIEYNTVINGFATKTVSNIACASVWCNNTNDTVFQYNDVSYTKLPKGCADGEAFDIDIANVGSVIQYNYTHDNEGGFLLLCNSPESAEISGNHTVRFNLSVNDGETSKIHGVFMVEGKNPGTQIYNNTVYMNGVAESVAKQYASMGGSKTDNFTFKNNIFCGKAGKTFKWVSESNAGWENVLFSKNVFCNAGLDSLNKLSGVTVEYALTDDPKFKNPDIDLSSALRKNAIKAFTPNNKLTGAENIANGGKTDIAGNEFEEIDFYGCVNYNVNGLTYNKSFDVKNPDSLTDINGNASAVKLGVAANLDSAFPGTDHKRIWWNTFVGDPTNWTDGDIKADTSIPLAGYNIQTADGTYGSSGFATYYSPYAVKDIRFDTSYSVDNDYWISEPLEFFASSDGVNFHKIMTDRETVGSEFTRKEVCNGMYAQIYDTYSFEEAEDIHYVRIVSTIKYVNEFSKQINRIYAIDYNFYFKEFDYPVSFNIKKPYSLTGQSGTVSLRVADYIGGAASGVTDNRRVWWGDFYGNTADWNGADTSVPLIGYNIQKSDGSSGASGEVVYKSVSAISNIRFDTSYSTNDDFWLSEPFEFYASSDGLTYKKISTERTRAGVELTHSGFLGVNSQMYDTYSFSKNQDIHYVKIVSTLKTDSEYTKTINRIYAVDYDIFKDDVLFGDIDNNGSVDILDLVHLKRFLAKHKDNLRLNNPYAADINKDKAYDAYDLAELKEILLSL